MYNHHDYVVICILCFSRDLLTICRQLNLEDSVDDLMKELGADKMGRISFDEFVRRRLELRTEINALRVHNYDPLPEYLPTSSDNSLGMIFWKFVLQTIK